MRVAGALTVAARASGVAGGLVAAGVAPGTPGWWAPLRRGVVGFAGTVAVGAGPRVKGTAMAGGPRVTDSAAAAAQFLAATAAGRPALCAHFSAAAGSLEPQVEPPGPGPHLRRCFHRPCVLSLLQVPTFSCRGVWMSLASGCAGQGNLC